MTDTTTPEITPTNGNVEQDNSSQNSEIMIPKSRFDEVNRKKKEYEKKIAEMESQLNTPKSEPQILDDEVGDTDEASRFVEKKALEVIERKLKENEMKNKDKVFLDSLESKGYPKPDLEDLKDYMKENGFWNLESAYKSMNFEIIVDVEKKKALKSTWTSLKSQDGKSVNHSDYSEKINNAKSKEELHKILRESGVWSK